MKLSIASLSVQNIMNLRRTDDMVQVKIRFHFLNHGAPTVFQVPRMSIYSTPTLFGEIKKIFLPPSEWNNFKLVTMVDNHLIPDSLPIEHEVMNIVEKNEEEKMERQKKSKRMTRGGDEEEEDSRERSRRRKGDSGKKRKDGKKKKKKKKNSKRPTLI